MDVNLGQKPERVYQKSIALTYIIGIWQENRSQKLSPKEGK